MNPVNAAGKPTDVRAGRAVALIFLLNGVVMGSWAAHIPLAEERLGIGHAALGFSLLAMAAGALVAMPFAGALIARLGSAAVMRAATIACFATFLLPVLAPDALMLPVALFVFGAANGAMDVAMNAHGVAVEQRLARPIMSRLHGMWSLGGLLGAGLAALLLHVVPPVVHALTIGGCTLLASIFPLARLLPSGVDSGETGPAFVLPSRASLGLGILAVLALLSEGAVLDWSALHLRRGLALDAGLAASGFAAFSACMAAGRFAGDRLRGRFGAVALVRASAFVAAAALVIALFAPIPAVAIAGFGIVGLGMSNLVPVFFGAAGRIPGQAAGTSIAAVATMGYAGFLAGPPLIGVLAQQSSLQAALALTILACVAIGIGATAVGPAERSAALAAAE